MATVTTSFNLVMTQLVVLVPAAATDANLQARVAYHLVTLTRIEPTYTDVDLAGRVLRLVSDAAAAS